MSNHVHLVIQPHPSEDISKIMQWILSMFAVLFNKLHGYKGHVWYDRFKSKIVESLKQLAALLEYIKNNPVKAGLVKKAENYKYCGTAFIKNRIFEIIEPPGSIEFHY